MNKQLLSAIAIMGSATMAYAQPSLTAVDLNPIPVEVFLGHQTDTTAAMPGAAGATATWNFTPLTVNGYDTTTYLACASTPYCDSFPGSNIALYNNSDYEYAVANSTSFSLIGANASGVGNIHINGHYDMLWYPLNYLSTHVDTFSAHFTVLGFPASHREIDSMVYDAYGTITTPSGAYPNAIRVRSFQQSWDTSFAGISGGLVEVYSWYIAGFHNALFSYTMDTSGGGSSYAEYYTQVNISLGADAINAQATDLKVFPNPATEVINLSFFLNSAISSSVTMTDLTGRTVATIDGNNLKVGTNQLTIPVGNLPAGMYLVRLQSAAGSTTQRVVVNR